ncbi:MAG: transglycosylase SLT domain-containing protein [Actinomycetes bacterium]
MSVLTDVTSVQSRVAAIASRFAGSAPASAGSAGGSSFASALSSSLVPSGQTLPGTATSMTADLPGTGSAAGPVSGEQVVADARRYLGVPYVWGGTNPAVGLDCSGLVQRVYADLGVSLPRTSQQQALVGTPVPSLARAQPGDLLGFGQPATHIAIYVGNGQMIEAPHPGTDVQVAPVTTGPTSIRRVLPRGSTASLGIGGVPAAYAALFDHAGATYGLPPNLLSAVAQVESGFNPTAVSPAGAQGLMQLMPGTSAGLGVNPFDPAQAVAGAAQLLSRNLADFGSLPLALAAYNAGAGAVRQYGGVPPYPQTQEYVARVLATMRSAP